MKKDFKIRYLINDDIYSMENYGVSSISDENFVETLNDFDSLSKLKQKEFMYYAWSLARNSNEMKNFPLEVRMNIFRKLLKHPYLLSINESIEIFETILTFKSIDFVEISKLISDKDQESFVKFLSTPDVLNKYNKSASAVDKFVKLSVLGEKVSKFIEDFIIKRIEETDATFNKMKQFGFVAKPMPSHFRNSYINAVNANRVKESALEFAQISPYADEKRILISLYKIDPNFVRNEFIPKLPSCEKYLALI